MRGRATGLEKKRGLTRLRPHCDEGRVSHFRLESGKSISNRYDKIDIAPGECQQALRDDQIAELRKEQKQGTLIKDLMTEYSLSKATIYRYHAESCG